MKKSEVIGLFIELMEGARDEYPNMCNGVGNMDKLKVDLEHAMEFHDGDDESLIHIAHEIEDCLRRRRDFKNAVEVLGPITEYFRSNKNAVNKLTALKKELEKIENSQETRIYTPRVRKENEDAECDATGVSDE